MPNGGCPIVTYRCNQRWGAVQSCLWLALAHLLEAEAPCRLVGAAELQTNSARQGASVNLGDLGRDFPLNQWSAMTQVV